MANGAEQEIPLDRPGIPMRLDAMHGFLYGLEELKTAPNPGDVVIAFIRPPDPEAINLHLKFMEIRRSFSLNVWLCPSAAVNKVKFRYYLLEAKIDNPDELDWEFFLNRFPGATAIYRVVSLKKTDSPTQIQVPGKKE